MATAPPALYRLESLRLAPNSPAALVPVSGWRVRAITPHGRSDCAHFFCTLVPLNPTLALTIFGAGAVAGALGVALGLGGGIFLVPFLTLALGFPLKSAAAISLSTVIATSSSVSARRAGNQLINLRFGMTLEVATTAGSLLGGITAQLVAESTLERLFGVVAVAVAFVMLGRINRRNVMVDPTVDTGRLGGRFHEAESGGVVAYRIKRLPLALFASFIAGNVSSLLGIGGGIIKVPVLNAWCGMPLRAAAATSALMIGVTATGGAIIYYGHGDLRPLLAAPAVLGVQAGSWAGTHIAENASVKWLKLLMSALLLVVSVLMFVRSLR
ncbi:MAG: sulfite exporter TauE/SafE family protein [Acidobacteria bacterium]|nr:MAG: sulfite exporter TauE/SafE family protein [Acidobacteriota bacterium]